MADDVVPTGQPTTATTGPPPGPARGGILRVALGGDPSTLDPWYADDEVDLAVVDAVHDGLVVLEPSGEVGPALAEQWWFGGSGTTPSEPAVDGDGLLSTADASTLTFRLREDATFHDGTPVVADDVVRGLRGLAERPDGEVAPFAHLLDVLRDAGGGLPGDAVVALDDRHVRLAASRPAGGLLELLAHPAAAARHPEAPDDEDPLPLGAGPFLVAQDPVPDEFVRLGRHAGWGDGPAGDGGPWLDEVIYRVYTGDTRRDAQFDDLLAERLDVARVPSSRRAEARGGPFAPSGTGGQSGATRLVDGPSARTSSYGFDVRDGAYAGSAEARALLRSAVDREAIVRDVLDDTRVPLDGIVSPGVPGGRRDACGQACDPVDGVVEVVDPAQQDPPPEGTGQPDGGSTAGVDLDVGDLGGPVPVVQPVTVTHDAGRVQDALAAAVARQLGDELGVETATEGVAPAGYLALLVDDPPAGPFRLAWSPDVPTPGAVLAPRFHSRELGTNAGGGNAVGGNNVVGLVDPRVDDLLDRADRAADHDTRLGLLRAAEDAVLATAATIPLAAERRDVGVARQVRGLGVDALGRLDLADVWIDEGP